MRLLGSSQLLLKPVLALLGGPRAPLRLLPLRLLLLRPLFGALARPLSLSELSSSGKRHYRC